MARTAGHSAASCANFWRNSGTRSAASDKAISVRSVSGGRVVRPSSSCGVAGWRSSSFRSFLSSIKYFIDWRLCITRATASWNVLASPRSRYSAASLRTLCSSNSSTVSSRSSRRLFELASCFRRCDLASSLANILPVASIDLASAASASSPAFSRLHCFDMRRPSASILSSSSLSSFSLAARWMHAAVSLCPRYAARSHAVISSSSSKEMSAPSRMRAAALSVWP
mmetsp:Transcript_72613/g.151640  ORF Transcript_72613/g.151640 Transcript_72613/m.151640 type:complete len:226 (+) Transcript_72613:444-1121(+)